MNFGRFAILFWAAVALLALPRAQAGDPFAGGLGALPAAAEGPAESHTGAAPAEESHASEKASATSAAKSEEPPLVLSVEPAQAQEGTSRGTQLILRLDRKGGGVEPESLAQALVIWTGPSGKNATVPLRWVDGESWASLIDPGAAEGVHRLRLEALMESSEQQAQRLIETEYELTLPERTLKQTASRELGASGAGSESAVPITLDENASAKGEKERKKGSAAGERPALATWGLAFVILMALNILAIGGGLGGAMLVRHVPAGMREKGIAALRRAARLVPRRPTPAVQLLIEQGLLTEIAEHAGRAVAVASAQKIVDEASLERSEAPKDEPSPAEAAKPAPEIVAGRANTERMIERLQAEANAVESGMPATSFGEDGESHEVDLNDLSF